MATQKPSKLFGAGHYTGIANVSNATPTKFDALQDQSLSVKADLQVLHGVNKWPEDICAGPLSMTGKVTTGGISASQWAGFIFASSLVNAVDQVAFGERGVVNGSNQITVANADGFLRDMGVIDVRTGLQWVCVAAGSITKYNQYSVSHGKYTFHPSRQGDTYRISYEYELANSSFGTNSVITNQPMGEPIDFTAVSVFEWKLEQNVWVLNKCMMQDAEISLKQGGHGKPTWSYMCGVDDNDQLGTLSFYQKR